MENIPVGRHRSYSMRWKETNMKWNQFMMQGFDK